MKNMIPFSPPFIDKEIIDEVVDTLQSGWITTGPKVNSLEQEVVRLTGCKNALCVNSWTSGAILVLKWFGVGPGDEVIVPAYTYSATALSVLHCGAIPIMVDVEDDFTIDPSKIEKAISSRTKVIMPVDIAGLMCDYDRINSIVNKDNIKSLFTPSSEKQSELGRILVLSDAAHSVGATYKERNSGTATDITIFSFHAVKNITTAEGGVICLNLSGSFDNQAEYNLMRLWSLNGQTKDAFTKSKAGGWKYDILFPGLKVNMPDLCAAVGLAQIKKYKGTLLGERKRVADRYSSFFSKMPWAQLPILEDATRVSCYHLYALRILKIDERQRDLMIDKITEAGVSVNVHFVPMPMLTAFKNLGYKIDDFPVAYDNYSREISLPIYPQLTDSQIDFICESVENAFNFISFNEENI
jgi:dTDP-4-amino-4,6-dideoxygalactose transaminase